MNSEYKLYLDMDGVLVNFDKGNVESKQNFKKLMLKYHDKSIETLHDIWMVRFWADLEWLYGGKELWEISKKLFNDVFILSSVGTVDPKKGKLSEAGKRLWVQNNMPDMPQSNVIIVYGKENKIPYANKFSILVDDMPITIQRWKEKGGYGILHRASNYKKTIEDLEDISRPIKISELVRRFFWKM
jgi:hypothetical protein